MFCIFECLLAVIWALQPRSDLVFANSGSVLECGKSGLVDVWMGVGGFMFVCSGVLRRSVGLLAHMG